MTVSITQFNGRTADASELAPLAFAGFAHFTALQIRDRGARGLDLHLARLRVASDELFGRHLSDEVVREYLHIALVTTPPDVSLTCFVSSRPGEFAVASDATALDVLVKVDGPAEAPTGPLTLDVIEHERHLPHIKHVGEVSKTLLLRRANAQGFDDAALTDRFGRLSEATIWNLAFWDGTSVIWPRADVLPGITMQILKRRLEILAVPQETREIRLSDLGDHLAAVVMNSWSPGIPVSQIGGTPLNQDSALPNLLHAAYAEEPPETV